MVSQVFTDPWPHEFSETIDANGDDSRSGDGFNDSIRLYLRQMGRTPLLTRERELQLAEEIDEARQALSRNLLCVEFVMRAVIEDLTLVASGGVRADRVLDYVLKDRGAKKRALSHLASNLQTLTAMLDQQPEDLATAVNRSTSRRRQRKIYTRFLRRRERAIRLVEELGLKFEYIQRHFNTVVELDHNAKHLRKNAVLSDDRSREFIEITHHTASRLRRRVMQLEKDRQKYEQAKKDLSEGNLRLVISVANKYRNRGVPFLDLIQEGNAGLMRATEKYDHRRGFRFSTYATWWIRQAISRATATQSRTVTVPPHAIREMTQVLKKVGQLRQELGRKPTVRELCQVVGVSEMRLRMVEHSTSMTISLDMPGMNSDESDGLVSRLTTCPDDSVIDPSERRELRQRLNMMLADLQQREREILTLRFGLKDGVPQTLSEVARSHKVSRERIRQVEQRAMQKLLQSEQCSSLLPYL